MNTQVYITRVRAVQNEVTKASNRMNRYLKRNGHISGELVSEELRQDKQYRQYRQEFLSTFNALRELNSSVSKEVKREASKCRRFVSQVEVMFAKHGFTNPPMDELDMIKCYFEGKDVEATYNIGCDVNAGYPMEGS